ncbi:hypothetical protein CK510_08680 [Brunnivagina elsteri CCALA 953]|uniref:Uncharacterized protein n=2 Tax=Brunnivagina TaxID=3344733 RepID=A0A2A2TL40_9CYAN|nr:hypothetical protein CK510_08680 [Calothrix elsteri CCALA 953]
MNLSFSRDGKILASSSFDGTVKILHLDKTKLQTLDLNNLLVYSYAWLHDYLQNNPNIIAILSIFNFCKYFFSGSTSGIIRLIEYLDFIIIEWSYL